MKKYIFEVRAIAKGVLTIKADTEEEALRMAHDGAEDMEWASFDEVGGREVDLLRTEDETVGGLLLSWWNPRLGIYIPSELATDYESDIFDKILGDKWIKDEMDHKVTDVFGEVMWGDGCDWDFRLGIECPPYAELPEVYEGEAVKVRGGCEPLSPYGSARYQIRRVRINPSEDLSFWLERWLKEHDAKFTLKSI